MIAGRLAATEFRPRVFECLICFSVFRPTPWSCSGFVKSYAQRASTKIFDMNGQKEKCVLLTAQSLNALQ